MISITHCASPLGVAAVHVTVEVDVRENVLKINIIGLPDTATREAKDRLIPALTNSGFSLLNDEIVINLSPADLRKEGPIFDLPMAIGLLTAKGQISESNTKDCLMAGEIALNGQLRPVKGVLAMAEMARKEGFRRLLVPTGNGVEGALIPGIEVFEFNCLAECVAFLRGRLKKVPLPQTHARDLKCSTDDPPDFSEVRGQSQAKRAFEIAAGGSHNILLFGPPGSGKSMLSKRLSTIMPALTPEEIIEVTRVYSCSGNLDASRKIVNTRPYRAPHHTASPIALIGGGGFPRPGEVTLAHRGILFLDEFPEFPRLVLEVLRQPLEDRQVTISRAAQQITFPADFLLVAAMNPCPCGWQGDSKKRCSCSPFQIQNYRSRLSGPLLDRIDLQIEVPALSLKHIRKLPPSESSKQIQERVLRARSIQQKRFRDDLVTNANMSSHQLARCCRLDTQAENLLLDMVEKKGYSSRVHDKILRIARTIADLDDRNQISKSHIFEALTYRQWDRQTLVYFKQAQEVSY